MYNVTKFTCLMCGTDVPLKHLTRHQQKECEQIQLKKFEEMDQEQQHQFPKQNCPKSLQDYFPEEKQNQNFSRIIYPQKSFIIKKQSHNSSVLMKKTSAKSSIKSSIKSQKEKFQEQQQLHDQSKGSNISKKNKNKNQHNLYKKWEQKKQQQNSDLQFSFKAMDLMKKPKSFLKDTQGKIECVKCKKMIPLDLIDGHEFQCSTEINCDYCGQAISVLLIQQHEKLCPIRKQWFQAQRKVEENKDKHIGGVMFYDFDENNQIVDDMYDQYEDDQQDEENSEQEHQGIQYPQYSFQNNFDYVSKIKHKGLAKNQVKKLALTKYHKSPAQKAQRAQQAQQAQKIQKAQNQCEVQKNEQQQEQPCSICYLAFQQNQTLMKLKCNHFFHPECVSKWFQSDDRCPLCKKNVV